MGHKSVFLKLLGVYLHQQAAISMRQVGAAGVIDDVALELMRFLDPESPEGLLHGYPAAWMWPFLSFLGSEDV